MTNQPKVPSPIYAALSQLYANLQRDQPAMANALKSTCQQMDGKSVWFGSAATSWRAQLDGYSSDLASSVNAAIHEVGTVLAKTPETCTMAEAKAWEMTQRMQEF